jgi:hypothetical protein
MKGAYAAVGILKSALVVCNREVTILFEKISIFYGTILHCISVLIFILLLLRVAIFLFSDSLGYEANSVHHTSIKRFRTNLFREHLGDYYNQIGHQLISDEVNSPKVSFLSFFFHSCFLFFQISFLTWRSFPSFKKNAISTIRTSLKRVPTPTRPR